MTKRSRDDHDIPPTMWARQLHLQWQNKALTNTELRQYVDTFRDYDNLNADNPKDIQNFLNKYFTFKENRRMAGDSCSMILTHKKVHTY